MLIASASVLPISAAIPLQTAFAAGSLGSRLYFFWQHINWQIVKWFVFGSLFGVYLGTLSFASFADKNLTIVLGVVILLLVWLPNNPRQPTFKRPFLYTGMLHSYLGALLGVGGILQPIILRTALSKLQITGTLAACLLSLDVMKTAGYIHLGFSYLDYLPHIMGATIAGYLGTWLGKKITVSIPEQLFRHVFRSIVSLAALRLIYKGFHFD